MPNSPTLTLAQAAALLRRDEREVARLCLTGRLRARRAIHRWFIDSDDARRFLETSGQGPWGIYSPDIERSLAHLQSTDLNEQWIPDILRHRDQLASRSKLIASASAILETGSYRAPRSVSIPKSSTFSRTGKLITVAEMLAYDALVSSIVEAIDHAMAPFVYSSRTAASKRYLFRQGSRQWVAWSVAVNGAGSIEGSWIVKTDLASYFDTVNLGLLDAELASIGTPSLTRARLGGMLEAWATVPGTGLIQGPNASRALGNLYLAPVDTAMQGNKFSYFRYMDDIRIIASSRRQAVEALRLLERECHARGLVLSPSKTEVLPFADHTSDALERDRRDAAYFLKIGRVSQARSSLHKIMEAALREREPSKTNVKFGLWRLSQVRDDGFVSDVTNRLDDLAPYASVVAEYLRSHLSSTRARQGISAYLSDPGSLGHPYLIFYLLALMTEAPRPLPPDWIRFARGLANDSGAPPDVRIVAANVIARSGASEDIHYIRSVVRSDGTPEHMARGFITALARVGAMDSASAKAARMCGPIAAGAVDYLETATRLPSLTAARVSIPLSRF